MSPNLYPYWACEESQLGSVIIPDPLPPQTLDLDPDLILSLGIIIDASGKILILLEKNSELKK